MNEKKILVPEALTEVIEKWIPHGGFRADSGIIGRQVCKWLTENPMVPTTEQIWDCGLAVAGQKRKSEADGYLAVCVEWQRRMFLAPEPEVPEEIKDLLYNEHDTSPPFERHNNLVIEAFRRGKNSR